MARIPEAELARLKAEVSVVMPLAESPQGCSLKVPARVCVSG